MVDQPGTPTPVPEDPQTIVEDVAAQEPSRPEPAPADAPREQEDEAPPKPPKFHRNEDREAIYDAIEAKKTATQPEFSGDPNDPDLLYGTADGEVDEETDALEREAHARQQQAEAQEAADATGQPVPGAQPQPQQQQPETVRVKIDGQEHQIPVTALPYAELPLNERINIFQMTAAADRRLADAKAILDAARQVQASTPAQPGQPAEPAEPGDAATTQPDDRFVHIAEAIQLGDTAEAAAALQDLIATATPPRGEQPSPQELAQSALFQVRQDEEIRQNIALLNNTLDQNEWLKENRPLQAVALNELDREMVEDFRRGGASDESIYERTGHLNPVLIRQLHRAGRAIGMPGFRPLEQIAPIVLERTKAWVQNTYGALARPAGQQPPPTSDRQARVQRLAPQPAMRAGPPARPAPQPESVSSIVEETRRARGFAR